MRHENLWFTFHRGLWSEVLFVVSKLFYTHSGYICVSQSLFQTTIDYMCLNVMWCCTVRVLFKIFLKIICKQFSSGKRQQNFPLKYAGVLSLMYTLYRIVHFQLFSYICYLICTSWYNKSRLSSTLWHIWVIDCYPTWILYDGRFNHNCSFLLISDLCPYISIFFFLFTFIFSAIQFPSPHFLTHFSLFSFTKNFFSALFPSSFSQPYVDLQ